MPSRKNSANQMGGHKRPYKIPFGFYQICGFLTAGAVLAAARSRFGYPALWILPIFILQILTVAASSHPTKHTNLIGG